VVTRALWVHRGKGGGLGFAKKTKGKEQKRMGGGGEAPGHEFKVEFG